MPTLTIPTDDVPDVEHDNPSEYTRTYKVLIADNSESAMLTTKEFFEEARCDVIAVGSREAAKLIIEYTAHELDAVVLDRRLTRDDDAKDNSGHELARETRREFGESFVIVLYSRLDEGLQPGPDGSDSPDEIVYISKEEHRGVLVETVIELIRRFASTSHRRPRLPIRLPPPVVILEDAGAAADSSLRAELMALNVHARPLTNLDDLLTVASHLPSASFILDLDACGRGSEKCIEAIREMKGLEDATGRPFYVAALAGGEEFMSEAWEAGADDFLVKDKDSAMTDALQLETRMRLYRIERDQTALTKPVTRLTSIYYKRLVEQLQEIKESPERGMAVPLRTVGLALDLPSLTPPEQLVLTSLDTQMRAVGPRAADDRTIDLCIEGAMMLADERASRADVRGWSERALRHSPDFILAWVSEEAFEELIDNDIEWDDD